jgi:hypothetical protein
MVSGNFIGILHDHENEKPNVVSACRRPSRFG